MTDDDPTLPRLIPLRLLFEATVEAGEPLEMDSPSGPVRLSVQEMRAILAPEEEDNLL
jgi:hypothetical protein